MTKRKNTQVHLVNRELGKALLGNGTLSVSCRHGVGGRGWQPSWKDIPGREIITCQCSGTFLSITGFRSRESCMLLEPNLHHTDRTQARKRQAEDEGPYLSRKDFERKHWSTWWQENENYSYAWKMHGEFSQLCKMPISLHFKKWCLWWMLSAGHGLWFVFPVVPWNWSHWLVGRYSWANWTEQRLPEKDHLEGLN